MINDEMEWSLTGGEVLVFADGGRVDLLLERAATGVGYVFRLRVLTTRPLADVERSDVEAVARHAMGRYGLPWQGMPAIEGDDADRRADERGGA